MKIGLNLPVMVPGFGRDTILEWSRRIDNGPFSSIAAGERVCFPNPEMMVAMSAAAAVTEGRATTIVDYIDVYASPVGNAFAYCDQP